MADAILENNGNGCRKRGRPDIFTSRSDYFKNADDMREMIKNFMPENLSSDRSKADYLYITVGFHILDDDLKKAFTRDDGKYKYQSILIQIGRMYMQDSIYQSDCIKTARTILDYLNDGYNVHECVKILRNFRKENKTLWTQS